MLKEKDRLVLSLYYYEELTLKEIGEILETLNDIKIVTSNQIVQYYRINNDVAERISVISPDGLLFGGYHNYKQKYILYKQKYLDSKRKFMKIMINK